MTNLLRIAPYTGKSKAIALDYTSPSELSRIYSNLKTIEEEICGVRPEFDPGIKLVEAKDGVYLHIMLDKKWSEKQPHQLVTTELPGQAKITVHRRLLSLHLD